MKNKSALLIAALLLHLFFSGCKRYEEDPITFRAPDNSLRRTWYLQSFTLNGKDSMEFMVRNKLAEKWSFGACQSSSICPVSIFNDNRSLSTYLGNWDIKDSGELYIEKINVNSWFDLSFCVFTILKLTTKELKIQDRRSKAILYFRS